MRFEDLSDIEVMKAALFNIEDIASKAGLSIQDQEEVMMCIYWLNKGVSRLEDLDNDPPAA